MGFTGGISTTDTETVTSSVVFDVEVGPCQRVASTALGTYSDRGGEVSEVDVEVWDATCFAGVDTWWTYRCEYECERRTSYGSASVVAEIDVEVTQRPPVPDCGPCCGDPDDIDCDGTPNGEDDDVDGDGIPNGEDPDVDGDGLENGEDLDVDGDGLENGEDPDIDGDGVDNGEDDDVDGDGLENGEDPDVDGDGLANEDDPDVDGDGIPNEEDDDIDGDGIPNDQDPEPYGPTGGGGGSGGGWIDVIIAIAQRIFQLFFPNQ